MSATRSSRAAAPLLRGSAIGWRLVASYLAVLAVAVVAAFAAGEALAPAFLEAHLEHMAAADPAWAADGAMREDLATQYRSALMRSLAWAMGVAAAATVVVGLIATRRILTPLHAMQRASDQIASGRYGERLDEDALGEFGALSRSFNTMARALDEAEERRRQMVHDLAHEIRTPLSNLRGYLEGLEDGVFEADAETASAFARQLDRLERLVEDLALLSRLDAGQVSLHPDVVPAADIVRASTAAFRGRFEERGVVLRVPAVAPTLRVRADPERCAQVFENLLGNALAHTPASGSVEVAVEPSRGGVRFEVRDTGPGVPPELGDAVFRRFVRGDPSRGRADGGGSGIGLTIAKELVERHGGAIGLEPRPGGGSIFWFTLPRT